MKRFIGIFVILALLSDLLPYLPPARHPGLPRVLAVESFLADIARNVSRRPAGGGIAHPRGCRPACLPALSPGCSERSRMRNVLIINGANLESFLAPLLQNAGGKQLDHYGLCRADTPAGSFRAKSRRRPAFLARSEQCHQIRRKHPRWSYRRPIRPGNPSMRRMHRNISVICRAWMPGSSPGSNYTAGTSPVGDQPRNLWLFCRTLRIYQLSEQSSRVLPAAQPPRRRNWQL